MIFFFIINACEVSDYYYETSEDENIKYFDNFGDFENKIHEFRKALLNPPGIDLIDSLF